MSRRSQGGRRARSPRRRKSRPERLEDEEVQGLVSRLARDFISIHAMRGEYLYVSENVEEMFGWRPEELIGHEVYEYVHPDDLERVREGLASHATMALGRMQYRLRCADGTWRPVETRCRAELSAGSVRHIVCLTRDVQREQPRPAPRGGSQRAPPDEAAFLLRIKEAIAQLGFAGSATAEAVARELGIGLRTLQRRLERQSSTTVSRLRSSVFREIAERMLKQGAAADEVTRRLGFSSRSSFQRAFRRWTGTTPGDFRRRVQPSH